MDSSYGPVVDHFWDRGGRLGAPAHVGGRSRWLYGQRCLWQHQEKTWPIPWV